MRSKSGAISLILVNVAIGLSLGYALSVVFGVMGKLETLSYGVVFRRGTPWELVLFLAVGIGLVALLKFAHGFLNSSKRSRSDEWMGDFEIALLPLLLLAPTTFAVRSFATPILFTIILGVCVVRLAAVWPSHGRLCLHVKRVSACKGSLIVLLTFAFCCFVIYGTVFQVRMFNAIFFSYDWCFYLDVVENTLNGKWFYSNVLGRNYMGQHFEPGTILLLTPYVYFFRSTTAFFVMNAAVLGSGCFALYALAMSKGLGRVVAFVMALLYLLHPCVSAMVLAIYYGFHEAYLAIPLIALFFVAFEEKRFKTAFLLLVLSLTIKETVAVFWIFVSPVMFLWGARRFASLIFTTSLVYFLVTLKIIIPWIAGFEQYEFVTSYYGSLGNSMTEILFSPLLKPSVFWPSLFCCNNFFFFILLLLPVIPAVANYPLTLWGGVGLFVFICLKDDKQLVTINSWYQSELVILVFISAVYALAMLRNGEKGILLSCLLAGFKRKLSGLRLARLRLAVLLAAVCASLLSFYFFNIFFPWGRNSWAKNIHSSSLSDYVQKTYAFIPAGATLTPSPMIAAHYILRNTISFQSRPPGEFILFDFGDTLMNEKSWETFRRRVLLSPDYRFVGQALSQGRLAVVFQRSPKTETPKFIERIADGEWSGTGSPFAIDDDNFTARFDAVGTDETQNVKLIKIFVRLMRKIDHDVNIVVEVSNANEGRTSRIKLTLPFGNGVSPCYLDEPGDTFPFILPIPLKGSASVRISIFHKPPPDFSAMPLQGDTGLPK